MPLDPQTRARAGSLGADPSDWSRLLFAAHWLVPLALGVPLVLALLVTGHAWLTPASLLIPLATSSVPYRCTIGATAITLRWAFFTQVIAFDSLETAVLGPDPRRWALGRRQPVLTLTRRDAQRILIFGKLVRLEMLRATLARAGIGEGVRNGSA